MKWMTIPAFADLKPEEYLGREHKWQPAGEGKRCSLRQVRRRGGYVNLHVLCRAAFEVEKGGEATLRITADDCYKLWLDGRFVGLGPAPGYAWDYYYNTYELTLTPGRHVLAAHIYYQGEINRVWNSGDNRFGLAAELTLDCETISLDWKYQHNHARHGEPTGYLTQYMENFDARYWPAGWEGLDFDDAAWEPMVEARHADYTLREQPSKGLAVYEHRPATLVERAPGRWFVDMGHEITGALRLTAKGARGAETVVCSGEELNPDGTVRWKMRCNCQYRESWKLAGCGEEVWEPYEYKGFRYAEITTEAELTDVCAVVRHYPLDDSVCTLETDDPWLGKIYELCRETIRYGVQDGYLDCPTREKGQYLGDAIISAHAQIILSGSTELAHKALAQYAQTERFCPGLLAVAPGAFIQEIADYSLFWGDLALTVYEQDGDLEFLARCYPVARRIVEHFEQYLGENGLLWAANDKWNLVDWPANLRDDYDCVLTNPPKDTGCHNAINAQFVGAVQTLEKMEAILGIAGEKRSEALCAAFDRAFYDQDRRLYVDTTESTHTSLHAQLFALYFGLQPEEAIAPTVDFIASKGLSCGVYTTYFLLRGLARVGEYELIYRLLTNESEHGWVNMLREGATTCMEAWGVDQKANTSLCHPFACSPIAVITEELCGVRCVAGKLRVEPHIPEAVQKLHFTRKVNGKTVHVHKADGRVWWEVM